MKTVEEFFNNKVEEEWKFGLLIKIKLLRAFDEKPCKKCGFIQGTSLKGFEKYYCLHLRNKIDRKLKNQKERLTKAIMDLVCFKIRGDNEIELEKQEEK